MTAMFLISVLSCSEERLFEEFHSFPSETWVEQDTVKFELEKIPKSAGKTLIGMRYTDDYPFSNCYIRIIGRDTLGTIRENKLINFPLFDSKTGQPRGKGFGNSFTAYDTLPFEFSNQTSELEFVQYMRQERLLGLEAIGLKILK